MAHRDGCCGHHGGGYRCGRCGCNPCSCHRNTRGIAIGGLVTGIIGTSLGVLNSRRGGILGGILGDGWGDGRGVVAGVEAAGLAAVATDLCAFKEIACKDAEIAKLKAEKYAEEKICCAVNELNEKIERKEEKLEAIIAKLAAKECETDKDVAVTKAELRGHRAYDKLALEDYKVLQDVRWKYDEELDDCRYVHAEKICPGPRHIRLEPEKVFEELRVRREKECCNDEGRFAKIEGQISELCGAVKVLIERCQCGRGDDRDDDKGKNKR